jgi:hypothetical protein
MNRREDERIIKLCFGIMETQRQLMPKLSLQIPEGIETEGSQRK